MEESAAVTGIDAVSERDTASEPYIDVVSPRPPHTSEETLRRGRERRDEIITAAIDLFSRDGYRGTGLAAIADRVGVSQPTLRHHFGTKEALLRAVVERRHGQELESARFLASQGGLAVFDALAALGKQMRLRRGLVHLNAVLVAENLLPEHPVHDWFVMRYRTSRKRLADALREGIDRGELVGEMDADVVATSILGLVDGLQIQWLLDESRVDIDRSLRAAAESFRLRYAARPPG